MFERFTRDARAIVGQAENEARGAGARSIEAEHLLLALARGGPPALAAAGLDHEALLAALEAEEAASLGAVGIDAHAFALPAPAPTVGRLRFGSSARAALERAVRAATRQRDGRLEARHVLLGVLAADGGKVPRTLELAGVDRDRLRAAV